jgi:hypothetical protein
VAKLRAKHLRDSLQDRVAREVAVRVVDVAKQVEVGHDQRHRAVEALGATDLLGQSGCEVARVEQAGLRIDASLGLQRGHAEGAVNQEQRREREGNEPGIRLPEGVDRDAERREHEVRCEVLDVEETRLA